MYSQFTKSPPQFQPTDAHNCHLIHNNVFQNMDLKSWKLNYSARNELHKIHETFVVLTDELPLFYNEPELKNEWIILNTNTFHEEDLGEDYSKDGKTLSGRTPRCDRV
jgi:hypothetical protein